MQATAADKMNIANKKYLFIFISLLMIIHVFPIYTNVIDTIPQIFLSLILEVYMDRWYKCGKALLDEIAASQPQPGEAYVWFMGQHGFIISLGGMVFYIDVILNDLLDKDGKTRRVYPPPFEPGEIQKVDYVLCTHNHSDHLNLKTLLPLAEANLWPALWFRRPVSVCLPKPA